MEIVSEFQGEYRWLSNFAPVKITIGKRIYSSVEHAYMSEKSDDESWKDFCADFRNTAGQVKRKSREINLRSDWELVKLETMKILLEEKFSQEPYKTKLIETGDKHLQEGNRWGDKFWGVCLKTYQGKNHLGNLIMEIRENLK